MQVAGPYDLLGAVRRLLPKTLKILGGETVDLEWYLHDEAPVTQPNVKGKPLAYPNGTFRILPPIVPRNAVAQRAKDPYRLTLVSQADTIEFADGTLTYEITEQDVAAVTSVVGTLGGTGGHIFVAGTDYSFTVDSIVWTGTGNLPDDATDVVYTYTHRMYYPRVAMDSRVTIRAVLRCQAYEAESGRHYSMSTLAAVLGSALEIKLRSMSANRLVRPATPDEPYTETITLGRVLAGGPLPIDQSLSMASWFIDFTLNVEAIHEFDAVQAILDTPFEVDLET